MTASLETRIQLQYDYNTMKKQNTGEQIEPGCYTDVSMSAYHEIDAVSASGLAKLKQSPAHLKAYREEEFEETRAMRLGRIIHTCVLETDLWEKSVTKLGECEEIKKSDDKPCTNDATGVYDGKQLCGVHSRGVVTDEGVKTVKDSDWKTATGIRDSILDTTVARKMVRTEGESEYTMIWEDPDTELLCKARMDRYSPEVPGGAIVDLKTTRSADPDFFSKKIWDYGYYLQACHYLKGAEILGLDINHFVILACEKTVPYGVRPYRMRDSLTEEAEDELYDLYHLWKRCLDTDTWPGYPDNIRDITLPGWAKEKMEDEREQISIHLRRMKDE